MTLDRARAVLQEWSAAHRPALSNAVLRGPSLAEAALQQIDFTNELAAQVIVDVEQHVGRVIDRQFLDYDPSYQTAASQVLVESLDNIAALASIDRRLRSPDAGSGALDGEVVAMAHTVGEADAVAVVYRLKGPGIATRRPRGWINLLPRDGVYAPVRDEILVYEPRFDVLTCGGYAFFTAVSLMHSRLEAPEKAERMAAVAFDAVTVNLAIVGRDDLRRASISDPTMRAKMAQVHRLIQDDPEYAGMLTTTKLVAFVKNNAEFGIDVSVVDGAESLTFDPSPQRRHAIPKLLADDYLQSELTRRRYEAGSKHRVS